MAVSFQCPCGRSLIADEAHRGMEVKCPACGRSLSVPQASGTLAQPVPPAILSPSEPASPRFCVHCGAGLSPADATCPKCGAFLEGRAPGLRICPKCGAQVRLDAASCPACSALLGPVAPAAPSPERPGLPWENRETLGMWPAAFQTLRKVLLEPTGAFSAMTLESPLGGAFIYFVIFGCGGAVIGAIWGAIFQAAMMTALLKFMPAQASSNPSINPAMMGAFQGILGVVLAPFITLISLVISSGMAHLALLVTGAKPKEFSVTMSVFAYAMGSAYVLQVVPFCGAYAAWIWAMVSAIVGLIQVHRCETWKAVVAVLWPLVLCCCCAGVAFLAVAGAGFAHA